MYIVSYSSLGFIVTFLPHMNLNYIKLALDVLVMIYVDNNECARHLAKICSIIKQV